jgi:hypothetical protein
MAVDPTTINPWIVFIDGLIAALMTGGEDVAKAYILTTPAAWAEGPVLSIFTNQLLSALGGVINKYSGQLVALAVIDVQTHLEQSQIGNAVIQVRNAQANGNASDQAEANTAFDNALANLAGWDGSGPPPP